MGDTARHCLNRKRGRRRVEIALEIFGRFLHGQTERARSSLPTDAVVVFVCPPPDHAARFFCAVLESEEWEPVPDGELLPLVSVELHWVGEGEQQHG